MFSKLETDSLTSLSNISAFGVPTGFRNVCHSYKRFRGGHSSVKKHRIEQICTKQQDLFGCSWLYLVAHPGHTNLFKDGSTCSYKVKKMVALTFPPNEISFANLSQFYKWIFNCKSTNISLRLQEWSYLKFQCTSSKVNNPWILFAVVFFHYWNSHLIFCLVSFV